VEWAKDTCGKEEKKRAHIPTPEDMERKKKREITEEIEKERKRQGEVLIPRGLWQGSKSNGGGGEEERSRRKRKKEKKMAGKKYYFFSCFCLTLTKISFQVTEIAVFYIILCTPRSGKCRRRGGG